MSETHAHRRVAVFLKEEIRTGILQPGTELESEAAMAERYQLSIAETRLVLGELANDGLIDYLPGRFTRVRIYPSYTYYAVRDELPQRPGEHDAYKTGVLNQHRKPDQKLYVSFVTATASIACRLQINEGDRVMFRQTWRQIDGVHWSIEASYYPTDLVEGSELVQPGDLEQGTTKVLAERGHEQVRWEDDISARMPHDDEAEFFEQDPERPVPVIEVWRTAFSETRPIRVSQTIWPADRNQLRYELGFVADGTEFR